MDNLPNKLPSASKLSTGEIRAAVSETAATSCEHKAGDAVTVSGRPARVVKFAKDESVLPSNVDDTCLLVYFDDEIGDRADDAATYTWVKPVGSQLLPIPEITTPHAYPDLIN